MSGSEPGFVAADEICVLRDVQIAQEIRSLAALGVFPKGILVYGLVYYQKGKRQYMISSDPAKLITFLNDTENFKLFPTPIENYSERLIIPEGEEADITNCVKLKLARILQEKYPEEIFVLLENLNNGLANGLMEEPLVQYRNELESVFNVDKIKAFRDLCTRAYWRKNLSELVYYQLLEWCDKRLAQLADYVPPMGSKQKIFYGFAVLEGQKIQRCVINANLSCIYEERSKLEQQGLYVTAWHEKIFTVEKQESLRSVNREMTEFLRQIYDFGMIDLIEKMEQLPGAVNQRSLEETMLGLSQYGSAAKQLGRYYGQKWGANQNT